MYLSIAPIAYVIDEGNFLPEIIKVATTTIAVKIDT
jgi:hypothetical protein